MTSSNQYSRETLIKKAQQLSPVIEKHQAQSNHQRQLAPEIIASIKDAGLFRLYQPKQWGGAEADPSDFFKVQNILAETCLSTAWVQGVLSVQAFLLAQFDQQAQSDVWGDDPETLVSSSFQPVGKAEVIEGGYRLSGRWTFSSGCEHAQWIVVGSLLQEEGKPPAMKLFLLPRSDYEIIDTWHTLGLRATGSNDINIEEAFIPEYRTFLPSGGIVPDLSRSDLPSLYHLPWLYVFSSTVANLGIGATRGALRHFTETQKIRRSILTGKAGKEDPDVHRIIAQTEIALIATENMFNRHIDSMLKNIERHKEAGMNDGWIKRAELTSSLRKLYYFVDEMQLLMGGRGVREDSPLTQVWLDFSAARSHPGNDPRSAEMMYGALQQEG